jgi:cytochrome c-type biogenesis protein CcmH/NrfF
MVIKLDKYHSDYLLWIFPLIILGLIFFAIKRDNTNRESGKSSGAGFNADSLITMSKQERMVDIHKMTNYSDSSLIFFASKKDDY